MLCSDILATPCGIRACVCFSVHVSVCALQRCCLLETVCARPLLVCLTACVSEGGWWRCTNHSRTWRIRFTISKMPVFLKFTHTHTHTQAHSYNHPPTHCLPSLSTCNVGCGGLCEQMGGTSIK